MLLFTKYYILLLPLLFALNAATAQLTISGTVYDSTKTIPIKGVLVKSTTGTIATTDSMGHYDIVTKENDSVSFIYRNKSTAKFPVADIQNIGTFDISLRVRIYEKTRVLPEVTVYVNTYREDSAENRDEFANGFDFEKPGIGVSSSSYSGTAGLDIDQFIQMFSFRKNRLMKSFQQRLIEEEEDKYIDYRFNKALIRRMTHLEGTDLDNFMVRYRPDFYFTQTSSIPVFYQYILDASYQFKKELLLNNCK